jgi:hypothetical protein
VTGDGTTAKAVRTLSPAARYAGAESPRSVHGGEELRACDPQVDAQAALSRTAGKFWEPVGVQALPTRGDSQAMTLR